MKTTLASILIATILFSFQTQNAFSAELEIIKIKDFMEILESKNVVIEDLSKFEINNSELVKLRPIKY